jgi:AcrR family transcriptional regulator
MTTARKPHRKPAGDYHHGDLRQTLIAVALVEVEKSGPDGLNLSALAKKLGVSQPAPYRHFTDREALLAELAVVGFRTFIAALETAVADTSKRPLLSRIGQAYVGFGLSHNGLYRLMFATGTTAQSTEGSELYALGQKSFGILANAAGADLSLADRHRRAVKIWVGLHGTVMLAKQGMLRRGATASMIEQLVEDLVQ